MRIGLLKAHEQNLILLYPALASARNPPVSIGTRPSAEIPYSCENPVVVQFDCHPEQAFFAQRRIWASRAMRRVPCDAIIARLARFLYQTAPLPGNNPDLRQRLSLSSRFLQNLRWNFFDCDLKLKHWSLASPPPAIHFPVSADKLDLGMCREIKQQRMWAAIEFLRKDRQRLGPPGCAIGRAIDGYIQGFLLNDVSDLQIQKKDSIGGAAHFDRSAVAFCIDYGSWGDQKCIHHDERIVANTRWSPSCQRIQKLPQNLAYLFRLLPGRKMPGSRHDLHLAPGDVAMHELGFRGPGQNVLVAGEHQRGYVDSFESRHRIRALRHASLHLRNIFGSHLLHHAERAVHQVRSSLSRGLTQ